MIRTEFVIAILAGAALALPYALYARRSRDRRRVFAIGLVVAALVYVALAAFRGTGEELLLEVGGVVVFGIVALLGVRHSIYWLALGWAAHVGWDVLLHPVDASAYAPWWYPAICIGFDLVVAGAIVSVTAPPPTERRGHE